MFLATINLTMPLF